MGNREPTHSLPMTLGRRSEGRISLLHGASGCRVVILDETGTELGPGQEGQLAVDAQNSTLYWFGG